MCSGGALTSACSGAGLQCQLLALQLVAQLLFLGAQLLELVIVALPIEVTLGTRRITPRLHHIDFLLESSDELLDCGHLRCDDSRWRRGWRRQCGLWE